MVQINRSNRIRPDDLKVNRDEREQWLTADERLPEVGESVYCTAGTAEVVRLRGRTGDGSRLLELRIEGAKAPFFAAASNVLVRPRRNGGRSGNRSSESRQARAS